MSESLPWHPMAVHFPLALVLSGACALSAARLKPEHRLASTLATLGTWNLALGALGACAAVATGLGALLHLEAAPAARLAIALHVKWAIFATLGIVLVAVWRGAGMRQDSRPSRLFVVLMWAVTAALVVTAYHGGQNVYRYGIGVASAAGSGAVPAE